MELEIDVISNELIKPSSPTPDYLHRYKLSFLDQVTADVYNPLVYFYASNDCNNNSFNTTEISSHLKNSLSNLLTHYYPLAGRVNYDEFFIDCNDDGVPFLETKVNGKLSDVVEKCLPTDLNKLVPFELDELSSVSMGIQLNVFECGGVAIGVCVSHKIGDALAFFSVINSWSAIARGEPDGVRAHLISSKLFPPKNSTLFNTRNSIFRDRVCKKFLLDTEKVESIRAKYAKTLENDRPPSRVEALTAFFYSRFLATIKDDKDHDSTEASNTFYLICHAVNIRSRLDPPLPDHAFGNYYRYSMTIPSKETLKDEHCHGLVKQVREEISKINKEFLKQFQEDSKLLETMKERSKKFATGNLVSFSVTSLCRMPIYEADFGWGKPVWIGSPALKFKNLVVFIDKKDGDGIEAYFHLEEKHMDNVEKDEEFLKYVTPTV